MKLAKARPVSLVLLGLTGALAASSLWAQTTTNTANTAKNPATLPLPPLPPPLPPGLSQTVRRAPAVPPKRVVMPNPTVPNAPSISARTPNALPPVADTAPAPPPPSLLQNPFSLGEPAAAPPPAVVLPPVVAPNLAIAPEPPPLQPLADPNVLKWDADTKTHQAKAGESTVQFTFWLTNVSSSEVLINRTSTSCGCTVAQLPSQPWHIPPGSNGPIQVTMNLVGKSGLISKGVTVDTSVGVKHLIVKTDIPPGLTPAPGAVPVVASGSMNDGERLQNMQMALADRQVVFKNKDCAKCHADPVQGKTEGRLIYVAACATCHNSHLRAAMVPDLRALKHPTDAEHWRKWITYGRAGSMMPAFAASEGGPLNEQQVNTLVEFMVKAFPNRAVPAPAQVAPTSPAPSRPAAQLAPAVQNARLNSGLHP